MGTESDSENTERPGNDGRSENTEYIDEVDANDQVTRVVTRRMMRAERLRHRAVFVAVFDGAGRLLIHRRSMEKDLWPGWYDIAVGGVVGSGESYESGARRELAEEMGIVGATPESIDGGVAQAYDDRDVSLIGRCFRVVHSGELRFTDGEVAEAWWVTSRELDDWMVRERFLPDSVSLILPLIRPFISG